MHEEFIRGKGNEKAFSLAARIISGDAKDEANPLFIVGESGAGKSALLQWIVNHMEIGKAKIIDTSRFIEHLVGLLKISNEKDSIRVLLADEDYGLYDTFLFEEVDIALQGKGATQYYFMEILELLFEEDMQVVLTSTRRMNDFARKLKDRFCETKVVIIKSSDQKLKEAIARSKIEEKGLEFTEEEIKGIASRAEHGGQIEGVINRLVIEKEIGV